MDDIASLGIRIDSLQAEVAANRMNRLATEGSKAEKAALGLGTAFKSAAVFAGLLGVAIYKVLEKTSEFQVLNANLVTATGSVEGANRAFAALKTLATSTPFTLQEVTNAFTKLVNYGLTPSERAIRSYGDAAAATGKPVVSMIEAVADAVNGEFERTKEAFNVKAKNMGDTIAFRFRGVTTEVKNNAKDIEEYFIKLGETNFAGGMARQMDTLKGKMSNLGDAWDLALNAIGSGRLSEIAKDGLGAFTDKLNEITAWAEKGGFDALMYQAEAVASSQIPQWVELGSTVTKVLSDAATNIRTLVESANPDSQEWATYWNDVFTKFPSNIDYMLKLGIIYFDDFMMRTEGLADKFKKVWGDEQFWVEVGIFSNPKTWFSWDAFNDAVAEVDRYREALSQLHTEASAKAGFSPLASGAPADTPVGVSDTDRQQRTQEKIDKLNEEKAALDANAQAHLDRAERMRQSLAEIDSLEAELNNQGSGLLPPPASDPGNPDAYNTEVPTDALAGFAVGAGVPGASSPTTPVRGAARGKSGASGGVPEGVLQAEYEAELLHTIYEKEAQNELEVLERAEEKLQESYAKRRADILSNTQLTQEQKAELIKRTDAQMYAAQEDMARKSNEAKLKLAGDFFGNLAMAASAFGKKGHKVAQAAAIAETVINTYSSATKAYSSLASIPYVGPVLGAAAAAAAIAAGMANVQRIRSTEYTGAYADGGIIPGNSTSGDRLSARVNSREMILNQGQQKRLFEMANGGDAGERSGGGKKPWSISIINNAPGYSAEVNEDEENKRMEVVINKTIDRIASQAATGGGRVDKAMASAFKLKR